MSCLRFFRTVPLAALLFSCLLSPRSNAGEQSHDAIDIGSRKQLFLDERLIASSRGVRLEMNTPYVMRDPVLVADRPWEKPGDAFVCSYSSVMRVDGKTRLWYHVNKLEFRPQPVGFVVTDKWLAYAESKDGIHFTKRKLGLNEYQGNRANNIVIPGVEGGHVWIDPRARAEHRYRFQTYGGAGKLAFYGSADGIRWKKTHTAVVGHNDTQNIAFWDAAVKRYLLFTRKWPGNFRVHRRLDSKDLIHWTNEVVVMLEVIAQEHVALCPNFAVNQAVNDDREHCRLNVCPELTLSLVGVHVRIIHSEIHEHDHIVRLVLQSVDHGIELLSVEVRSGSVWQIHLDEVLLEQFCECLPRGLLLFLHRDVR